MKKILYYLLAVFLLCFILISFKNYSKKENENKPNIIFISVDDLRPQLNCYGQSQIISPNIDSLASQSYLYENAICNFPVCGASRASVLTGLRPNPNRFKGYDTRIDVDANDVPTIGEWYKENGYYTLCLGKISHHKNDSPESWSVPAWRADKNWRDYQTTNNIKIAEENNGVANAFEKGENIKDLYADTKMVSKAINELNILNQSHQPFFLAIGFLKPHLPFNAPKEFWDMYDEKDIQLASNRYQPKNSPKISMHNYGELRYYTNIPNDRTLGIPDSTQIKLIHGYYACVSYIDYEIGRLINHLKKLKIYDKSIIVLWGDHGWQLGEHNLWAKHSNYQTSLKVPLIIKYNNQKTQHKINSVVELLDLYPTLCDLSNIQKPKHLQGKSLISINEENPTNLNGFSNYHNGFTLTNNDYSYTVWKNKEGKIKAEMMYDLNLDSDENNNISNEIVNSSKKLNYISFLDSVKLID